MAGWEWRKGSVVSGVTTICGAHLDHSNPKKYVQLPVYCDAYRDTKRSRAQQKKRCSTNPGQLFNSPYFAVLSAIPKDPERSTSGIANPMFKSSYFTILCAAGGDPKLSERDAIDPPFGEAECADLSYFTKVGATCDFFRNLLQTHPGEAECAHIPYFTRVGDRARIIPEATTDPPWRGRMCRHTVFREGW